MFRVISTVVVFLICLQLPAFGQGFHHRRGMGGPPPTMEDWVRKLDLDEAQVARIREMQETLRRETLPLRDTLMMKRFRLRDLLNAAQADADQVLGVQREVSELEAQLQERITIFQLEVRKVLTPDQINLLPSGFGLEPFQRPGMMPGRGHRMGPP